MFKLVQGEECLRLLQIALKLILNSINYQNNKQKLANSVSVAHTQYALFI